MEELKTKTIDGKRFYVNSKGLSYPSITTVLGHFNKKSLQEWRKRVGEEEANKISRKASTNGTRVHNILEQYLKGNPYEEKLKTPLIKEQFYSMKKLLDEHLTEVKHQEIVLYSNTFKIAGRVDLIGVWKNNLTVIDFKTSKKPKKIEWIQDYFLQTSFYAAAYYEMTNIPIKNITILIVIPGENPQIFEEKPIKFLNTLKKKSIDFHSYLERKHQNETPNHNL